MSTHQLIIHDAFKACAVAYVAMATAGTAATQWWHATFGSDSCVSAQRNAYICSDRRGPPWGRKVSSIAGNMAVLS